MLCKLGGTVLPPSVGIFSDNTLPPGTHMGLRAELQCQSTRNKFYKEIIEKGAWFAVGFSEVETPLCMPAVP